MPGVLMAVRAVAGLPDRLTVGLERLLWPRRAVARPTRPRAGLHTPAPQPAGVPAAHGQGLAAWASGHLYRSETAPPI